MSAYLTSKMLSIIPFIEFYLYLHKKLLYSWALLGAGSVFFCRFMPKKAPVLLLLLLQSYCVYFVR